MSQKISRTSYSTCMLLAAALLGSSQAARTLHGLLDNLGYQLPQDVNNRVQQAVQIQQEYNGVPLTQQSDAVPKQGQQQSYTAPQQQETYNQAQQPADQQQQQPSQQVSGGNGQFATKLSGSDPLELHNAYRSYHGSQPLTWDDSLRASAKKWCDHLASSCSFYHSGPGENLASGFSTWTDVMWAFYVEYKGYNFNAPGYSSATGHFTQLIWRDTQRVGCDTTNSRCMGTVFCCHYDPVGNVNAAQYFQANVFPPTASAST